MFIKFANTNGDVFELHNDDDVFEYYLEPESLRLGNVLTYPEGIVIIDRDSNHITSQLNVDDILELLRQLVLQMYLPQINNVNIHLPKMVSSMMKDAEYQNKFQNLLHVVNNNDKISYVCSLSHKNISNDDELPKIKVDLYHV